MPAPKPLPPIDELRDVISYDPETGRFIGCNRRCRRKFGREVGCKANKGRGKTYVVLGYGSRLLFAHRVAWLFAYGTDPGDLEIDHINGDGLDNRISNLRLASHAQNAQNSRKRRDSKSQSKGISFHRGGWQARINVEGKVIYLGRHRSEAEAAGAYAEAAIIHHKQFARLK